jgi:hypothetical protein
MDHHLAIALAIFAVGVIIATASFAHHASSAALYASLIRAHNDGTAQLGTDPLQGANSDFLLCLTREGASWARRGFTESHIWAVVVLVAIVMYVGYLQMYARRK